MARKGDFNVVLVLGSVDFDAPKTTYKLSYRPELVTIFTVTELIILGQTLAKQF